MEIKNQLLIVNENNYFWKNTVDGWLPKRLNSDTNQAGPTKQLVGADGTSMAVLVQQDIPGLW